VNSLYIKVKENNVCVLSIGSPHSFTLRTTRRTATKWRPVVCTRQAKVSSIFKYCSWRGLTSPEMAVVAWQLTGNDVLRRRAGCIVFKSSQESTIVENNGNRLPREEGNRSNNFVIKDLHYEWHLKILSKLHEPFGECNLK